MNEGEFFSYGIGARTYGCIWPNRIPEPEMWQMKKSAQPVSVIWNNADKMEIEVVNRHFFTNLGNYDVQWNLEEDGISIESGNLDINAEPQTMKLVTLPIQKPQIKPGAIYLVTISFHLKSDTQWAKKGFEVAWDQLEMKGYTQSNIETGNTNSGPLNISENDKTVTISGSDFSYIFNKNDGNLQSYKVLGKELLKQGPNLNVWRAPLANEMDDWTTYSVNVIPKSEGFGNMISTGWYSLGLDQMKYTLEKFTSAKVDENVRVSVKKIALFGNVSDAGFESEMVYVIYPDGKIELTHTINPQGKMPVWLPRMGTEWILDQTLQNVQWLGRGPQENYPDRKTGYRIGQYKSTVDKLFEPYLLPEDNGLRTDNNWVKMVGNDGVGLEFSASKPFNFNCYNYTTGNLSKAKYTYQLTKSDAITFNFDYQSTGVGCTARSVFNEYQTIPQYTKFTAIIKPVIPIAK